MKEVTRIINVEITMIGEYDEKHPVTKEDMAGYIKDCVLADKVVVKDIKEFVIDKKKGKK